VESQPQATLPPQIFRSSTIPQPPELKDYLTNLLNTDAFNKFCVDCHHNLSTHASITYGIFICANCAEIHRVAFGQSKAQIKDIFNE